jgi:hypothetical protein
MPPPNLKTKTEKRDPFMSAIFYCSALQHAAHVIQLPDDTRAMRKVEFFGSCSIIA